MALVVAVADSAVGTPTKHLKLLRPDDTLLIGRVYRLVSYEGHIHIYILFFPFFILFFLWIMEDLIKKKSYSKLLLYLILASLKNIIFLLLLL